MRFVGKDPYFPKDMVLEMKQYQQRSRKTCEASTKTEYSIIRIWRYLKYSQIARRKSESYPRIGLHQRVHVGGRFGFGDTEADAMDCWKGKII